MEILRRFIRSKEKLWAKLGKTNNEGIKLKDRNYLYKKYTNRQDFYNDAINSNTDRLYELLETENKTKEDYYLIGRVCTVLENYKSMNKGMGEKYPSGAPKETTKHIFKIGKYSLIKELKKNAKD